MSSKTSRKTVFVFDFDGVICDSTIECLVVSWNAWQKYFGLSDYRFSKDEFNQNEIDYFLPRRPYVKGAGEYYPLWLSYFASKDSCDYLDLDAMNTVDLDVTNKYKKIFYACREELKNIGSAYWLDLHIIFHDVIAILKMINDSNRLYIATLKDEASVLLTLGSCGLDLPPERIFDQSTISSKVSALNLIADLEAVAPGDVYFFDDNANHLLEPKENKYTSFLTTWGAHVPDFIKLANEKSINIVESPDAVLEVLKNHLKD